MVRTTGGGGGKSKKKAKPKADFWGQLFGTAPIQSDGKAGKAVAKSKASDRSWNSAGAKPWTDKTGTGWGAPTNETKTYHVTKPSKGADTKDDWKSRDAKIVSGVSESRKGTGHRTAYKNPDLGGGGGDDPGLVNYGSYKTDPAIAAAIANLSKAGTKTVKPGGDFKGNLADYVAKYKSMLPSTDYGSLISNAQQQAATGDQNIEGVYNGLGAYIAGLAPGLKQNAADEATALKGSASAATDMINGAYDSARQSVAAQLNSIGGMQGTNPDPSGTTVAHQTAQDGDIAAYLQHSLDHSASNLSSTLAFNAAQGSSAQMQGAEQRADLQKELAKMVAQYRTQQSQENAQNALQALSMGTSQFNADRSDAESQAAQMQQQLNDAYQRQIDQRNFLVSQDNENYNRWSDNRNFKYQQGRDSEADLENAAKFQFEQDQANAGSSGAAPGISGSSAASLWSSVYASTLKANGGDKADARKAANKAVAGFQNY